MAAVERGCPAWRCGPLGSLGILEHFNTAKFSLELNQENVEPKL